MSNNNINNNIQLFFNLLYHIDNQRELENEEQIIHNHLNVYKLMKVSERQKKIQYRDGYELNDIINYL